MPIYRFQCNKCELVFEKVMTISQKCDKQHVVQCPSCENIECEPLLSRTSFSLKGDGWYRDGYGKGKE